MPRPTREQQREYQREWKQKRRDDFFSDKQCAHCGSTSRLELDHIDPSQKVDHKIWSWRAERRLAEIAKCQILCRPCHEEKTYTLDRPCQGHGTRACYQRGCKCAECRAANAEYRRRY